MMLPKKMKLAYALQKVKYMTKQPTNVKPKVKISHERDIFFE